MGEAVGAVLEDVEGELFVLDLERPDPVLVLVLDLERLVLVLVLVLGLVLVLVLGLVLVLDLERLVLGLVLVLVEMPRVCVRGCLTVSLLGACVVVMPQPSMQGDVQAWADLYPEDPHPQRPDRERGPPEPSQEHDASMRGQRQPPEP